MGDIFEQLDKACELGTAAGVRITLNNMLNELDGLVHERIGVCKCVDKLYKGYGDMLNAYIINPDCPMTSGMAKGMVDGYVLAFSDVLEALAKANAVQMAKLTQARETMYTSGWKLADFYGTDLDEEVGNEGS